MTWLETADFDTPCRAQLGHLVPQIAPAGTVGVVSRGRDGQRLCRCLVRSGDVFLTGPTGREIQLYAVESGQGCIQSTLGLLGGEDYSGEAITRTHCQLVLIPRDMFVDLMESSGSFRTFVFTAFAGRMQNMMHLLERGAFQPVESRLAQTLLERSKNDVLQATHAEIAVMIGSAREVVSRRLDAMAKRHIVRLDRGVVQILDRALLRQLAATDA